MGIRHYQDWSTSDPMWIRVFPLYDYYNCSAYSFLIFVRPLWHIARNLKHAFYLVGTTEMIHINIGYYENQSKADTMLIRLSPFYAYFNLPIYYIVILSSVMKYSAYCVASRKKNRGNNRHSEVCLTLYAMLIRDFPLYGYYILSIYYFNIFYRPTPQMKNT